jgi:urocanate hydratase
MVIVCDGAPEMDVRLSRVLNSDSGMGIVRHADAGYDIALDIAKKPDTKIKFPSL